MQRRAAHNADLLLAMVPFAGGRAHRIMDPAWCDELRAQVLRLCGWRRATCDFPGSNPVSLSRARLADLATACAAGEYAVSEKVDGVRFLLCALRAVAPGYGSGDGEAQQLVLMMDRSLNLVLVSIGHVGRRAFDGTVLDGELVYDDRARVWWFVAFDVQAHAGETLTAAPFVAREQRLQYFVTNELDQTAPGATDPIAFRVTFKAQHDARDVRRATTEALPLLPYACDGLVFTPMHAPMRMGRDDALIKWKSGGLAAHTVDLQLMREASKSTYALLMMGVDGRLAVVRAGLTLDADTTRRWAVDVDSLPQPVIVECVHDGADVDRLDATADERRYGRWLPWKLRADKNTPNYSYTLEKTVENIREDVQLGAIIDAIEAATLQRQTAPPSQAQYKPIAYN